MNIFPYITSFIQDPGLVPAFLTDILCNIFQVLLLQLQIHHHSTPTSGKKSVYHLIPEEASFQIFPFL